MGELQGGCPGRGPRADPPTEVPACPLSSKGTCQPPPGKPSIPFHFHILLFLPSLMLWNYSPGNPAPRVGPLQAVLKGHCVCGAASGRTSRHCENPPPRHRGSVDRLGTGSWGLWSAGLLLFLSPGAVSAPSGRGCLQLENPGEPRLQDPVSPVPAPPAVPGTGP